MGIKKQFKGKSGQRLKKLGKGAGKVALKGGKVVVKEGGKAVKGTGKALADSSRFISKSVGSVGGILSSPIMMIVLGGVAFVLVGPVFLR